MGMVGVMAMKASKSYVEGALKLQMLKLVLAVTTMQAVLNTALGKTWQNPTLNHY